jgi:hypothetical protein
LDLRPRFFGTFTAGSGSFGFCCSGGGGGVGCSASFGFAKECFLLREAFGVGFGSDPVLLYVVPFFALAGGVCFGTDFFGASGCVFVSVRFGAEVVLVATFRGGQQNHCRKVIMSRTNLARL